MTVPSSRASDTVVFSRPVTGSNVRAPRLAVDPSGSWMSRPYALPSQLGATWIAGWITPSPMK